MTLVWRNLSLAIVPAVSLIWSCDMAAVWGPRDNYAHFLAQLHPTPMCAAQGHGDSPWLALEDARSNLMGSAREIE